MKGNAQSFSVDYDAIDNSDILNILTYLMIKNNIDYWIILMIKNYWAFTGVLASIANTAGHTKYVSLNNQQCMNQTILVNLHHNEFIEGLHYYHFTFNLDRCMGSCDNFNDRCIYDRYFLSRTYAFQTKQKIWIWVFLIW